MDRLKLCICLSLGVVPGGLGSRCRTRLFSGSARDGKCSRPILERDVCLFLYELPCANQAIIRETKRRVEKQQDFLLNYYAIRYRSAVWNHSLSLSLSLFRSRERGWHWNRAAVGRSFLLYV